MDPRPIRRPSATAAAAKVNTSRRRAERRVAHRVPCRVRASDTAHGKAVSVVGQTVNRSANGMAVQVGQPMDEGARVEVLLPHLDGEPTRLMGTVAHSRRVVTGTFEVGIWIEPELPSV
ncbi:MAG: PilZ domain-containing protein [Phycisphaerae bacterium]